MHKNATFEGFEEFVKALEKAKIKYVVVGGFAIDGRQKKLTREHNDIDILCLKSDEHIVEKLIKELHYSLVQQHGDLYKLTNSQGVRVDLYLVRLEHDHIVSKGKHATWTFPKELLMHDMQKAVLNGVMFNIPNDAYIKKMAIDAKAESDTAFTSGLVSDEKKMGHMKRILRPAD